jgi:hypothetical protein
MFKKGFSHTLTVFIITTLLSSLSVEVVRAHSWNQALPLQKVFYGDNQLPDGLATADWSQIRSLILNQNIGDVVTSPSQYITNQQAYLKASNTEQEDDFTYSLAISGDTVVVGAYGEDSNSPGVDGNQGNNDAPYSGAVYVFVHSGTTWSQQAYLKASNPAEGDSFGYSVAVSGDTVVVGATGESGLAYEAGAAYVFVRSGTSWSQQAYLKASNPDFEDLFGFSVAVSGDTVVVGAPYEDSSATGVNGNESDNSAPDSGAAYVFVRSGTTWSQQAYLKASTTNMFDSFGESVALSGNTVVVGAPVQDSAGAAYVFVRTGITWNQQAYLKGSNTEYMDAFGTSVAVSDNTLVVGAPDEDSKAKGVNGDDTDNSVDGSGAAFVFIRNGTSWSQQAYLKASNTDAQDKFGLSVSVSSDTVAVGALWEASNATGVNGDQNDNSAESAGAAYVFTRSEATWSQQAYLKASNTDAHDWFGYSVAVSGDTLAVGAYGEDSNATGVNGDQNDNSASEAGAAYIFAPWGIYLPLVYK